MKQLIIFVIGFSILAAFTSYQNRGIEQGARDLNNKIMVQAQCE